MIPLPKTAVGDHELVSVINRFIENHRERTPLRGEGYDIDFGPNGWKLRINPSGAVGGGKVEQLRVEAVYRDHLLCKPVTLSDSGLRTVTNDTFAAEHPTGILVPHTDSALIRVAKPDELRYTGWDSTARSIAGEDPEIGPYQFDYFPNGSHPDTVRNPYDKRTRTLVDGSEYDTTEVVYTDEVIYPPYQNGHSIIYAAQAKVSKIFSVTEQVVGGDPDHVDYDVKYVDLNSAGRQFVPAEQKIRVCVSGQTGTWYVNIRASDRYREE